MAITRIGPNQSINLASNITGTLPVANGGTAITSGFINGTATPGKVLQVVNAHTGTQVTSNSATYTDTTLTASITPSSTSSKILVLVQQSFGKSGADTYGNIRVYRDSTEIGGTIIGRKIADTDDSGKSQSVFSFTILDSPSSTSALTFKTQFS